MDSKTGAASSQMNNFEPSSDLIKEDECDTLLLYLPGFKKEQLRVQLARSGILRISGTRPVGENKWSSFQKDFPVSENCETTKISAKFEGGILYVRQPKLIVPAKEQDNKIPHLEVPKPQKIEEKKTTTSEDDQIKKTTSANPENSVGNEEKKPMKDQEEKINKDEKNLEKKHDSIEKDERKGENVSENAEKNAVSSKVEDYKLNGDSAVAKLKKARKIVNFVFVFLALLFAFVLGMYANKPVSEQAEN